MHKVGGWARGGGGACIRCVWWCVEGGGATCVKLRERRLLAEGKCPIACLRLFTPPPTPDPPPPLPAG